MQEAIGVAVLGLGKWSRQLAAAVQRVERLRLVSCYTRTAETRSAFADEFNCQAADSVEAAIGADGVQAALVTAPSHVHPELAAACIAHGVHVFVEKPMANTVAEAQQITDAGDEAGLVVMVGHQMRRFGTSRAMKQAVDDGTLGKPVSATGAFALPGRFEPFNWRCGRDTNRGGALMQLGIHHIETFTYLFGPVTEVRGTFANAAAPYDVDDVGAAFLIHESGVTSCVTASYVSPLAYQIHLFGTEANIDCILNMQHWPDTEALDRTAVLMCQTRSDRDVLPVVPQDSLALQLDEFARCITDGDQPETGAAEGLATVATVEAALLSYTTGEPVDPRALLYRQIS